MDPDLYCFAVNQGNACRILQQAPVGFHSNAARSAEPHPFNYGKIVRNNDDSCKYRSGLRANLLAGLLARPTGFANEPLIGPVVWNRDPVCQKNKNNFSCHKNCSRLRQAANVFWISMSSNGAT